MTHSLGEKWPRFEGRPDFIIIDNWFWQIAPAAAEDMKEALNRCEEVEDTEGVWRHVVNDALRRGYPELFELAHRWIHLESPSWGATVRWRTQFQEKLVGARKEEGEALRVQGRSIESFLHLFQRWAERVPVREPDVVLELSEDHSVRLR